MSNEKRKGLAVVYDPHNLYQFIWYYATYGKDIEWDALCLPNGYKGEYMSEYCEKSGIFKTIYKGEQAYLSSSILDRGVLFAKMVFYAVLKKQKIMCKKIVGQYVNIDNYDIAVVLTDVGIVSGAVIGVADEKEVVILEDGMGDYADRPKDYLRKHILNPFDWQGYFVAKMGYSNPAHYYPLNTTKNCYKYSSHPDKMIYKNYKKMDKLFDYSSTDMELFQQILKNIYSEISEIDFEKCDTVVFTNRLYDFGDNVEKYINNFENHIAAQCKNVILKKHPRDETKYDFGKDITIQEVENSVPAEVLLPFIRGKKIIFMLISSIMLYMDREDYEIEYLYFNGLYDQMMKENTFLKYVTIEEMKKDLVRFELQNLPIKEI